MSTADFAWSVRAARISDKEIKIWAASNTLVAGKQASLATNDPHPSSIELLLAALASDLASGLGVALTKSGVSFDDIEVALSGRLENVLVHLGVIGESGDVRLTACRATLHVTTSSDREVVELALKTALERAPVYRTLLRATEISIELRLVL